MSKKAFLNESLVSKRSEQAKRDIEILNAELQQLIETGRNRSTVDDSLFSSRLLENSKSVSDLLRTSDKTTNQERKPIKKTDLHPHTTTSKQFAPKSPPITVKSQKEKQKTYDVEQAREYMRKQKERRLNSLKHDLKSSEQVVQDRKQKLKELKEKTSKIVNNNVKRSRSRSKSKEKNSNEDISRDKQSHHISRKLANTEELNIKPDVITNIRSIPVNDGSVSTKETFQSFAVPDNVTVRIKSPRITTSASSNPYLIVSEGTDINKAAIKIQAAFRGCKERKRFKKLLENRRKMNIRTVDLAAEETEHKKVPKWLQTKIASAPYNVVQTFKRKLAFAANANVNESKADKPVQCTKNLQSREEIKQRLKDSVKNSTHKDLKSFLSHKCLDLDLKKVEELNLISKQNIKQQKSAEDSDSDTSKNIPDLSTESSSKNVDVNDSKAYSLNINSERLKELKLHSTNISLRANQQLNQSFNSEFSKIHKTVGNLPKSLIETFNEKENAKATNSRHSSRSNTARKDSSYIPTEIDPGIRCIELDSSKEVTLNSPRNLFNPNKMNDMLLLTKLNVDLDESIPRILDSKNNEQKIGSAEMSENALSVIKSYSQPTSRISHHKSMNKDLTLNNSEVVLEICSHGSKKQSAMDYSSATNEINTLPSQQSEIRPPIRVGSSKKIPKLKLLTDAYSELVSPEEDRILQIGEGNNTQSIDDSIFSTSFESDLPTEKTNKILSSTAKCSKVLQSGKSEEDEKEKVLPLKIGETVTTTACSNQINVKFQAELHLLNDFNQSLYNLVGIEKSLNNLHGHNQNTKTIYQNQNTQTSFIISNNSSSRKKNSDDFETTALNSSAVSSVDCSLLNGSVFEKFEKISNTTKDDSMLNDTQLSKNCNNSIIEAENNFSFKEATRTLPMSQETLSLQYFEQLIKDEDARRDYLKTIFEIRKSVLMDRNKVDLSMLEIRRKHLIETGQLNEASALKKKQRGILIKLEHEKYEMQRLMQMQKAASKERKNILKQQQNVIKAQLTLNDATTVTKIKKNHQQMGRRSSGPLKVFAPTTPHQQRSSTNHRRSDNSVASRCSSSVAEELIVTTSYYTDSVRLSDGSDNQTVASVTSVTQETSRKMTVTTEQKHDKDGESESIDEKISESDGNKTNVDDSVRSCIEYLDRSIQSYNGRNNEIDINNDRSIVARNDRGNNVEIVDAFRSEIDCFGGNRQLDAFSIENMEGMATVESQNEINKRVLLMKEDALQKRRKAAEELLEWHQRLLEEEKKVAELEMAATTVISHLPMQQQNKPFTSTRTTELTTFAPQIQQQRNIPRQDTNTKTTGKESNVSPPENVIRNISARSENSVKSIEDQVINNNLNEVHSDYEDNDKLSSVVSEDVELGSKHATSDSYSCEFDPGEATDNVEEEEVSLKTVKSSEHNEDANILKSQSTLNEIMHNISIISEELSEIYRISSGNNKLNIAEDGQLVECVSELNRRDSELVFTRDYHIDALLENGEINKKINADLTVENNEQSIDESNNLTVSEDNHDIMSKTVEGVFSKVTNEFLIPTDQSVAPVSDLVSSNFNLEEAEIIEQNIRIIEKEIEELQSKSLKTADIYEYVTTKERNLTKFVEFSDKQEVTDEKSILEGTENAETTISNNLVTDSQIKNDVLEENILSEENGLKDVSEKLMEDISSTKASEIVENLSSIDPIEISEDRTGANSESISQNITEILENGSNINENGEVQTDCEVDQNSEEIINKSNSNKDDKCDVSNSENNSEVFAKLLHEGKASNPQEDITTDYNQITKDSNNLTEISLDDVNNANVDSVNTLQSFDLDGSFPEKSELLSLKAPDIIESLNRNTEEIESHSSSKMPEILENLNEAVQQNGSSKTTSPSHSSEPSLEEPLLSKNDEEMSEDFDEVSIDLPSSEAGIAIANDDILNTVRMCTNNLINQAQSIESKQDINNAQEDNNELTLDESSININATFNIDKSIGNDLNSTYVVPEANLTEDEFTQSTFEEDISSRYSLNEENLIDITLLNDSNKENETPISRLNKEERYCSIYGGGGVKYSAENDDSSSTSSTKTKNSNRSSICNENSVEQRSNGVSSKADGVVDVKKRVSEILADAKQKTDRSTRIQDLYTTTYDVNFTEKASDIASELDQQNSEYISPKLVEVKAEELELLKKQWAIEQEIKQLEEQQLSEQREQLPYQYLREIPNKPPPPYTPPVNQVPVITIPSVIPSNISQLSNVVPAISDHLYTCYLDKSLHSAIIPEGLAEFNTPEINELLFDLCKELTETHYDEFRMTDDSLPSWLRMNERLSSLKKPLDKDGLCEYLLDKVVDLYGFKEKVSVKESSVMRWSRKKRDHVDEVLVRELQADECNWTNFEEDELIVQDQLVNDLVDLLLEEVIDELKDWWTFKST